MHFDRSLINDKLPPHDRWCTWSKCSASEAPNWYLNRTIARVQIIWLKKPRYRPLASGWQQVTTSKFQAVGLASKPRMTLSGKRDLSSVAFQTYIYFQERLNAKTGPRHIQLEVHRQRQATRGFDRPIVRCEPQNCTRYLEWYNVGRADINQPR